MEQRKLNVMFAKAGAGNITTRMTLPKKWIDDMGILPDERGVLVTYDPETKKIIIEKLEKENG